jgi:hypothetical protein
MPESDCNPSCCPSHPDPVTMFTAAGLAAIEECGVTDVSSVAFVDAVLILGN